MAAGSASSDLQNLESTGWCFSGCQERSQGNRPSKLGLVGRQGFEPWKPMATDLQSAPFVHLGTCPCTSVTVCERAYSQRGCRIRFTFPTAGTTESELHPHSFPSAPKGTNCCGNRSSPCLGNVRFYWWNETLSRPKFARDLPMHCWKMCRSKPPSRGTVPKSPPPFDATDHFGFCEPHCPPSGCARRLSSITATSF